jgi:hypothetical protein
MLLDCPNYPASVVKPAGETFGDRARKRGTLFAPTRPSGH